MVSSMPVHPEKLLNEPVFPENEGKQYEFRTDITPTLHSKVFETICGFLNSDGGFIIVGVNTKTREVCGVSKSIKEIDRFILLIDTVYQKTGVINQTTKEPVPHGHVICKPYKTALGKTVIIIEVKKNGDEEYQLHNGTIVYRANASNYVVQTERVYTEQEYFNGIKELTKRHAVQVKIMVEDLQKEAKKTLQMETEKKALEELLAQKIIQEKYDAEVVIGNEHEGVVMSLFKGCFGFMLPSTAGGETLVSQVPPSTAVRRH